MRPIEYRFYHKYENKMYYNVGFTMIGVQSYIDDNVPEIKILDTGRNNGYLLQFTGLYDCKGEKIFEGDLLLDSNWNIPIAYEVRYKNGCFWARIEIPLFEDLICEGHTAIVIGNIYEHPYLLEKK